MKAIIRVDVPKYQIGEPVSIYFKDTMTVKSVCEADATLDTSSEYEDDDIDATLEHIRKFKVNLSVTSISKHKPNLNDLIAAPDPDEELRQWLKSFNTESASKCFVAVQELKKRLEV